MSDNGHTLDYKIAARKESLSTVHLWLTSALAPLELSIDEFHRVDLALSEWITNIIIHGKGLDGPDSEIRILLKLEGRQVTLEICDTYAPFNPKTMKLPGQPHDLEHASRIGYGVSVILNSVSDLEYSRVNGENRLQMRFDFA